MSCSVVFPCTLRKKSFLQSCNMFVIKSSSSSFPGRGFLHCTSRELLTRCLPSDETSVRSQKKDQNDQGSRKKKSFLTVWRRPTSSLKKSCWLRAVRIGEKAEKDKLAFKKKDLTQKTTLKTSQHKKTHGTSQGKYTRCSRGAKHGGLSGRCRTVSCCCCRLRAPLPPPSSHVALPVQFLVFPPRL